MKFQIISTLNKLKIYENLKTLLQQHSQFYFNKINFKVQQEMGASKSGIICNDSDFDIKYYLSSQIAQSVSTHHTHEINPQLQLNIQGNLRIGGWKRITETQKSYTENIQSYEVLAGRVNTTGLDQLEMNSYFITVKAVIGKYEKLLIGNCPVRNLKDIRYKIRQDLSYRQMEQKQADKFILLATKQSTANQPSYLISNPQRETRRQQYLQNLQKISEGQPQLNSPLLKNSQIQTSTKIYVKA